MELLTKQELDEKLAKLGPEPLAMSSLEFSKILNKTPNANIKSKLMDQSVLAGVGNIYALEALYHAKIHPRKNIHEISKLQLSSLHKKLVNVLNLSIKNNGTSVSDYMHLDGKGSFQNLLAVYKQPTCPLKHNVEKIKQSGRGSYFCSTCQA